MSMRYYYCTAVNGFLKLLMFTEWYMLVARGISRVIAMAFFFFINELSI